MRKPFLAFFLALLSLVSALPAALGEGGKVFRVGEADAVPFSADEETFDLYVCPLLGADCMILTAQGQTMLVDCGKAKDYETIRSLLESLQVSRIDRVFNSHPHDDHLGSMKQLVADYPIGVFMTAFPENYTGENVIQVSTLRAVHDADIPVVSVADGDAFTLGDAQLTVLQQSKYGMPNPRSAMLMIVYGECRLLLTADVIGAAQAEFAQTHDLKADIFKFPHHGLNRVALEFLDAIDPEYAFFTHGYANTKDAQAQLTQRGVPHDFATWGVIHLSSNGAYWLVEQTLNEDGQRYAQKYPDAGAHTP